MRRLIPTQALERRLVASWLIKTIGSGLYLSSSALYFTRVVGLSPERAGVALAIGGLVSLAAAVPIGSLADRWGARTVYTVLLVTQGAVMAALSLVRSFPLFVAVIVVFAAAEQGSNAARGALVATAAEGAERVRLRARLRVITNVGISIGAGLAALSIQLNTVTAYTALLLGTALTYPAAAIPLRRSGSGRGSHEAADTVADGESVRRRHVTERGQRARRSLVLGDRRYVAMTALATVLTLQAQVLAFAVPLWITGHTKAPRLLMVLIVVVNTVMVILFQARASRGTEDDRRAARLCRRSGLALFAACAVIAPTAYLPGLQAALLLLVFAVFLTLGELWFSAGTLSLSFSLAPSRAHGQYQGFFSLAKGVSAAAAPALLSALCLGGETSAGWLVLGTLFVSAGSVMPLVIRPGAARAPRPEPAETR